MSIRISIEETYPYSNLVINFEKFKYAMIMPEALRYDRLSKAELYYIIKNNVDTLSRHIKCDVTKFLCNEFKISEEDDEYNLLMNYYCND